MEPECACGHVLDEHVDGAAECTVAGCPCVHFDEIEPEPE